MVMCWTPQDDARLRELYPTELSATEIGAIMGRNRAAIRWRATKLGLKKPPEIREALKRRTTFQKGQQPWNKGKEFNPGGRSVETRFKKLAHPSQARNYKPIGSLRINSYNYLERKVTDDHPVPAHRWVPVHRLVWEEAHGPLPEGHIVRFKKGMRTNVLEEITIDRLECISRRENMQRNTVHNYPQPIPQLVQLRGALQRQINRRQNREK